MPVEADYSEIIEFGDLPSPYYLVKNKGTGGQSTEGYLRAACEDQEK